MISIQILPSKDEEKIDPSLLVRDYKTKLWYAENEDGTIRGLYSNELKIAHFIHKNLIEERKHEQD